MQPEECMGHVTVFLNGGEAVASFQSAIDNGYRLLDSAYNYENEGILGEAIRKSRISREELVVTSKLPGRYHEYIEALKAIEESLFRASLDHFDKSILSAALTAASTIRIRRFIRSLDWSQMSGFIRRVSSSLI